MTVSHASLRFTSRPWRQQELPREQSCDEKFSLEMQDSPSPVRSEITGLSGSSDWKIWFNKSNRSRSLICKHEAQNLRSEADRHFIVQENKLIMILTQFDIKQERILFYPWVSERFHGVMSGRTSRGRYCMIKKTNKQVFTEKQKRITFKVGELLHSYCLWQSFLLLFLHAYFLEDTPVAILFQPLNLFYLHV